MLPSSQLVLHHDEQHAPRKSLALLCTCPLCPSSTPTLRPALPGHPICLRWPLQLLCQGQLLLLFCSAKHAHVKTKVFFQQQTVHKMSLSRKLYIATEAAAAALTSHAPVGLCLPITQFLPSLLQNTLTLLRAQNAAVRRAETTLSARFEPGSQQYAEHRQVPFRCQASFQVWLSARVPGCCNTPT